jgi:hypothetical protein
MRNLFGPIDRPNLLFLLLIVDFSVNFQIYRSCENTLNAILIVPPTMIRCHITDDSRTVRNISTMIFERSNRAINKWLRSFIQEIHSQISNRFCYFTSSSRYALDEIISTIQENLSPCDQFLFPTRGQPR